MGYGVKVGVGYGVYVGSGPAVPPPQAARISISVGRIRISSSDFKFISRSLRHFYPLYSVTRLALASPYYVSIVTHQSWYNAVQERIAVPRAKSGPAQLV